MIDSDKPDYDFDHVNKLINVAEKTRDYPKLKKIHDAAMAELEAHANPEPVDHFAEQEPGAAAQKPVELKRNL